MLPNPAGSGSDMLRLNCQPHCRMHHPTVVEKNYEIYRIPTNPGVSYLHHPSGVTVIVLDSLSEDVESIEFGNKKGTDRGEQTRSSGGKKGALRLQPDTRLCTIHTKDGPMPIRAGIQGFLAEVNDNLRINPNLLRTDPMNRGYLAICTYAPGTRRPPQFKSPLKSPALF